MLLLLILSLNLSLCLCQVPTTILDPIPLSGTKSGFGMSSVSGDWLVVTNQWENLNQGAAYLYDCSSPSCVEMTRFGPDSPIAETFGASVAMDFPLVVVGAPGFQSSGERAVLFNCSAVTSCAQLAVLNNPDNIANQEYGQQVSISGNYVAVGAPLAATRGKTHLFDCSNLPCQPVANIAPGNPSLTQFGRALSLSGTNLLVGASHSSNNAGAASFFDCSSGSCVEHPLSVPSGATSFGVSVSLDGSLAAIGSLGVAYIFDCSSPPCSQELAIPSTMGSTSFEEAVGLKGDLLAVGTRIANSAALYQCPSPSSCTLVEYLSPSVSNTGFGFAAWLSLGESLFSITSMDFDLGVPENAFVKSKTFLSFPFLSFPFLSFPFLSSPFPSVPFPSLPFPYFF